MELEWHILGALQITTKQTKVSQRRLTNSFTFKPSGLKEPAVSYTEAEHFLSESETRLAHDA